MFLIDLQYITYDDWRQKKNSVIYVCAYIYVTSKTYNQTINSWINWLYKKFDRFDIQKITPYKNRSISVSSSVRPIWVKNDNDIYISHRCRSFLYNSRLQIKSTHTKKCFFQKSPKINNFHCKNILYVKIN